jgi:hypothetical protein
MSGALFCDGSVFAWRGVLELGGLSSRALNERSPVTVAP